MLILRTASTLVGRIGTVAAIGHLMVVPTLAQPVPQPKPLPVSALKTLSIEELGNIEVTTTRKEPEQVWQTAAAVFVISAEDVRRSGATTLPDLLRLAAGVSVSQSDANRWAVGVRGFGDVFSKNVLVMIDGRSVYTPLVGGVHWAIQDLPLADIARVEVIRGPGGSVWGANAVNGIINVITKSSADTQGPRLTAVAGTVERARVTAGYGGAAGSALHYRVYAKGFDRAAQFHPDGAEFDAWRSARGGFRVDWDADSGGRVMISGDLYRTTTGERAQVSSYIPASIRDVDGSIELTGGNLLLQWDRQTASGGRTHFQAYYDRTDRAGFTFGEVRHTVDADFNMRLRLLPRHELTWGLGARVSPSTVTQVVPTLNFVPNQQTGTLASGFAHDDIAIVRDRLSLSVGLKLEHNNYTGLEFLPSGRLLWMPGPRHSIWASITRSVRTPSRFERDLSFQVLVDPTIPIFGQIAGNPEFQSETLLGTEIGYRKLLASNLYLDVAAFNNSYGRLAGIGEAAISTPIAPIPHVLITFPFENSVDGATRGVEIAPDWKPLSFWQLKGSYSYLHLTADNRPGFTNTSFRDNYRGQSPAHQVRVQSRLDLPGRFELDGIYRSVSALTGQRVPAYQTLDGRFGWWASERVELSVTGQNLLQPHHPELNAVPVEIRRGVYARVTFNQ